MQIEHRQRLLVAISTLIMGPIAGGFLGLMGLFAHLIDSSFCSIPLQIHLLAFIIGPISCVYITYRLGGLSLQEQIQRNKEFAIEDRRRLFGW